MKNFALLYVFTLAACATAPLPDAPSMAALARGPLYEITYDQSGNEIVRTEWKQIDGGKRLKVTHYFRDGTRKFWILTPPYIQ